MTPAGYTSLFVYKGCAKRIVCLNVNQPVVSQVYFEVFLPPSDQEFLSTALHLYCDTSLVHAY